jgi:hypothetical protein
VSAQLPLEPPFLVQKGGQWYFVAPDGAAWRVTDTLYERRRHREMNLGSPKARYRCFVAPDKTRRVYEFKPGDLRRLDEDTVARQLRESAFLPTGKPDLARANTPAPSDDAGLHGLSDAPGG